MKRRFSKKEALIYGWRSYKKNAFFLSGLLVLIYIVQNLSNYLIKSHYLGRGEVDVSTIPLSTQWMYLIVLVVVGSIISTVTRVGMIKVALKIYRGEKVGYKDFFTNIKRYITFLFASILYTLIFILILLLYLLLALIINYFVEVNSLVLLLPLIVVVYIVEVSFVFYGYLIVDSDRGVIRSFEESEKLINGYRFNFSLLLLLIILLNILGIITIIGNLITIPISLMAITHIYMKLSEKEYENNMEKLKEE